MSGEFLEERIRALGREEPSIELRARILAVAESVERPRVTLTEQIWASRPLRIAWAAALAILVLLDPAFGPGASVRGVGRETRDSAGAALRKLARESGLPGDRLTGLMHRREIQFDVNRDRREEVSDLGGELEM